MDIFYHDWFTHPNWWFKPTINDDEYLTNNYEELCDMKYIEPYSLEDKIAYILIHDQLIRHIVRHKGLSKNIIDEHLKLAVQMSEIIHPNNELTNTLTWTQWCFSVLPFRHSFNRPMIIKIIQFIWDALETPLEESDKILLIKTLKATYSRCPMIEPVKSKINHYSPLKKHANICQFMPPLCNITSKLSLENRIVQSFRQIKEPIIVSLSGGVDSMVCAFILKCLGKRIVAVHINYDNRIESNQEQEFVEEWCNMLDIPCWTRHITEIHRPSCMKIGLRETYESYTKCVRMDAYCQVWKLLGETSIPYVILGHHLDDGMENVLTNIISCTKYDDLFGMTHKRLQDGIYILRPMMDISKEEIIQFAYLNNIPYLKDSTVEWSARGKLRDIVFPALGQWTDWNSLSRGFKSLEKSCRESLDIIKLMSREWMEQFDNNVRVLTLKNIPKTALFYRHALSIWNIYPTNKAINSLLDRLKKIEQKWDSFLIQKCFLTKQLSIEWKKNNNSLEWKWIIS